MGTETFYSGKEDTWLTAFMRASFYERCTRRDCYKRGPSTIYCTVCMGNPFCVNCKGRHENNFKDHKLLEVRLTDTFLPYPELDLDLPSLKLMDKMVFYSRIFDVSAPPNSIFSGCRLSRQVIMLQSSIKTLRKSCRLRESESIVSIQTRSFFFDVGKPRRIWLQGKDTAKDVTGLWTIKLLSKSPHLQVELAKCNNPSTSFSSAKLTGSYQRRELEPGKSTKQSVLEASECQGTSQRRKLERGKSTVQSVLEASEVPAKLLHGGSEPLEIEPACPSKEVAGSSEIEAIHKINVVNYRTRSRKGTPCRSHLW